MDFAAKKKKPLSRPAICYCYECGYFTQNLNKANIPRKGLGSFSIRFRRDANESDEEISIVRNENSPDVQTESNYNGKSENSQNSEHSVATSPSSTGTNSSGDSSNLSSFNLRFLPKNPTLNSGSEGSSFEKQTQKEPCQNSMGEIVFKASHFEQESDASPASPKRDSPL